MLKLAHKGSDGAYQFESRGSTIVTKRAQKGLLEAFASLTSCLCQELRNRPDSTLNSNEGLHKNIVKNVLKMRGQPKYVFGILVKVFTIRCLTFQNLETR